jgi:ornithine carbamoyltransferase
VTAPLQVSLEGRDLLRISDLVPAEAEAILDTAVRLKGDRTPLAPGSTLGLYFSKHSTRTRVSFSVAMAHLGGTSIPLSPDELQLSRGESLPDTARALSRYVDVLAVRTHAHAELEAWAEWASVPVLNARTNAKAKGAAAKRIESRWISRCRGDRFITEVFSSA